MTNEELRRQIYSNLNLKETDDLLSIWQVNNRGFWSDDAFEVIKRILQEREVDIPPQNQPVYEVEEKVVAEEAVDEDGLDEWEARALDDENQPEFYDTLEVITLKDNIHKTAKAVIVVSILEAIPIFRWCISMIGSYFPNRQEFAPLIYLMAFALTALSAAISIAVIYFPLKALVHILRILMEMEFRSRKGI